MPTPARSLTAIPAFWVTRSNSVVIDARIVARSIAPGWREITSSAIRLPAKSTMTAVCSRSDSFIPATR